MTRDELRAAQAPLKEHYRSDPKAALITLKAEGLLGNNVSCKVSTARAMVEAGLHEASGGSGMLACSGDMLLESLVACSGVTLQAVATSMGIALGRCEVFAEGDLDFRGTLGVDKSVDVGFQAIRLRFVLESSADASSLEKLRELTERYCVVYQTLTKGVRCDSAIENVLPK